ncbi:Uncharacterized protein HZ326_11033 [Fusarium oxysporum f. sp. albedinis]|nr:Uncharacterized protein HZ326_11033 [Fusarium oxysporum f. sp. albedinis]
MINDSAEPTQLFLERTRNSIRVSRRKASIRTPRKWLSIVSRICNITEEPEIRLVPEHAGLRAGVRLQPLSSSRQAYVIVSFYFSSAQAIFRYVFFSPGHRACRPWSGSHQQPRISGRLMQYLTGAESVM